MEYIGRNMMNHFVCLGLHYYEKEWERLVEVPRY
jgi:hypothetical protein